MMSGLQKMFAIKEAMQKNDMYNFQRLTDADDISDYINQEDAAKKTLIFHACNHPDEDFAIKATSKLIERGANIYHKETNQQTVLYYLANTGKDRLLKTFLDRGFSQTQLNNSDYMKQSPLFYAATGNYLKCAEALIKHGANVDHLDLNCQNALFYAASKGHLEMCKLLVNRNSNFSIVDANKQTPLHYAKKNKQKHVVDYLIGLKKSLKKQKDELKVESSQQESRGRKKKQLLKQQYCLVFTSEDGYVQDLNEDDIAKFKNASEENEKLYSLMINPEKLENEPFKEDKKFQKICNKILTFFQKHQHGIHFLEPLDYIALNIPHYPKVIKYPMDFSTIKTKLTMNAYDSEEDFWADMHLIFDNCILFNGKESSFGRIAFELKLEFETMYKKEFP